MALPIKPAEGTGGRGRGPAAPGVAIGEDSVDWPRVFEAMKIGGVKNYFIEQEQANGLGRDGERRRVPQDAQGLVRW